MRRSVLIRSAIKALGGETSVTEAAFMWQRHRHMVPFALLSFVALMIVATLAGTDDWPTLIVLGAAGAAVAVAATSQYRIVAETPDGAMLLQSSRIRQYATGVVGKLDRDASIVPVGGTVFATDWEVDGDLFTVPRSSQGAIERISSRSNDAR